MSKHFFEKAVLQLQELRLNYSSEACLKRSQIIKGLKAVLPNSPQLTQKYYELLIFLVAHPDSNSTLKLARSELSRMDRYVTKMCKTHSEWDEALEDSGIQGTHNYNSFTIDSLAWLSRFEGKQVEVDWKKRGAFKERIDEFLQAAVFGQLADAVLNPNLTTQELVQKLAGKETTLAWLCKNALNGQFASKILDEAFAALDLWVNWRVTKGARSAVNFPTRPIYYHQGELRTGLSASSIIKSRLPHPIKLKSKNVDSLIDAAMATLLVRGRETDPVTYANRKEITLFRLEQGIDVALFGLAPARRLPIESYFGFVAAKNRVPVGYGGAWILGDRGEIGVNIFDTFRGADSITLFSQIMRVYYNHLGAKRFIVQPYQFGEGNEEGLASGAFWFYYKLGFRPADKQLCKLAESEYEKRKLTPTYRASAKVLKKLTGSKIICDLGSLKLDLDIGNIGLSAAKISSKHSCGFRDASPFGHRLPLGNKAQRLKFGPLERNYVSFLQQNPKIIYALAKLAKTARP